MSKREEEEKQEYNKLKRSEIASLEAYPLPDLPDDLLRRLIHSGEWRYYQEGYEQAEKDTIQRIRREIERRTLNAHELPDSNPDKQFYEGKDIAFSDILSFLDTLEKE